MGGKMQVGIIGCGMVSKRYIPTIKQFDFLNIAACADLNTERAASVAAEFQIPCACSVQDMLSNPHIDIIVNLTIPQAHYELSLAAVKAGKHVYNEKPLTATREQAQQLLSAAEKKGVRVGCAPDTFLSGTQQTMRSVIDSNGIGKPSSAVLFFLAPGPEISYHQAPEFFYQQGGGPLFDTGPYYLTALVALFGPVKKVCAMTKATYASRTIGTGPRQGHTFPVETPTHITGALEFANGLLATIITSFDVWSHQCPPLEIYGTQGTLRLGSPNMFKMPLQVRAARTQEWNDIPVGRPYAEGILRGLGVAEMAAAIRQGRPHRASGALAYHVQDVMHCILESGERGTFVDVQSACTMPEALPENLVPGSFDEIQVPETELAPRAIPCVA